jgi:hypothetical protein
MASPPYIIVPMASPRTLAILERSLISCPIKMIPIYLTIGIVIAFGSCCIILTDALSVTHPSVQSG